MSFHPNGLSLSLTVWAIADCHRPSSTQVIHPSASQSEPYIADSATRPPLHSHGISPEHVKVAAVDAVRASYHSFLDCYTVPKFGMLRSHRISKHLPRQPKAMSFQNKSSAFVTVTGGLLNLSCLSGGTGGSSEASLGTVWWTSQALLSRTLRKADSIFLFRKRNGTACHSRIH